MCGGWVVGWGVCAFVCVCVCVPAFVCACVCYQCYHKAPYATTERGRLGAEQVIINYLIKFKRDVTVEIKQLVKQPNEAVLHMIFNNHV